MPNIKDFNLKFEVDVPEPRVDLGRLAVGGDGTSFRMVDSSDVWQCPITGTFMLKPLPLTGSWDDTFTGTGYVRTALSGFTFTTPGNFKQVQIRGAGDYFIRQYKGSEERFTSTTSYVVNSCYQVGFYNSGIDSNSDKVFLKIDFNYNTLGDPVNEPIVQLWFYGNGKCEVYKNGSLVESYDRQQLNFAPGKQFVYTQALQNKFLEISIIPFRNRDLLVHTSFGLSFVHSFVDLDPSTLNIILPAGKVSFRLPTGKGSVQLAQMYFKQSGYIIGSPIKFRYTPPASYASLTVNTRVLKQDFGSTAATPTVTASIVRDTTGFPAFVFNGTNSQARIKVALSTTNPLSNSAIFCADAWVDPTPTTTANSPVDVTSAITELSLNIDEDGEMSGAVGFRRKRLIDLGIQKAGITSDRPYRISLTNVLSGTIDTINYSPAVNGTGTKFTTEVSVGDSLYTPNGVLIGVVASISSNTLLLLDVNANMDLTASSYYKVNQNKTGTITCTTASAIVTGTSTLFTTNTSVNQGIYAANTGAFVGIINTITNNTSITLTANAAVALTGSKYFVRTYNTGSIDAFTYSNGINGTGTAFLSEIQVGDRLYTKENTYIGEVQSISSNTSLFLVANSTVDLTAQKFYDVSVRSSIDLVRGTLSSPTIVYQEGDTNYNNSQLSYEIRDRSYDFEVAQLTDSIPLDGMTFTQMMTNLFPVLGLTASDFSISTSTFTIPQNPDVAAGSYNVNPSREDTVKSIISKIKNDYAANWITGWRPDYTRGAKYYWVDPSTFVTTPLVTLYQSVQSAINSGIDQSRAQSSVIYALKKQYEVPEANSIFVTGIDNATGALIYSFYNDTASQTAATSPSTRPNNWLGRNKSYILIDPSITNQTAADQAKTILQNRLTTGRVLIEFESEILTKTNNQRLDFLWLGDAVRIMMPNGTNIYGEFRIIAIPSIDFQIDNGIFRLRRCTYRAEMIGTNAAWYAEGLL